jgi:hypothetical protein
LSPYLEQKFVDTMRKPKISRPVDLFETDFYKTAKKYMTPGTYLRIYRENHQMTQEKLGASKAFVCDMEHDRRDISKDMNTTSSHSPRPNRLQMGNTRTTCHSNHAKYNNGRREAAAPLGSLPCEKIPNTTIIIWDSPLNKSLYSMMTKSRLTSENHRDISPPYQNYRYDQIGRTFIRVYFGKVRKNGRKATTFKLVESTMTIKKVTRSPI